MTDQQVNGNGTPEEAEVRERRETSPMSSIGRRLRVAVWVLVTIGLVAWFAIGSVSTTSYTYNQFVGMTYRNVSETPLQEIWSYQVERLPEAGSQWALDAGFQLALLTMVLSVVGGSWLLLVRVSNPSPRTRRRQPVPVSRS